MLVLRSLLTRQADQEKLLTSLVTQGCECSGSLEGKVERQEPCTVNTLLSFFQTGGLRSKTALRNRSAVAQLNSTGQACPLSKSFRGNILGFPADAVFSFEGRREFRGFGFHSFR